MRPNQVWQKVLNVLSLGIYFNSTRIIHLKKFHLSYGILTEKCILRLLHWMVNLRFLSFIYENNGRINSSPIYSVSATPDADFVSCTWKNTAKLILYLIFKETAVEKDKL